MIGNNMKALREANKFTQKDVATFLKIDRSAYANYESGIRKIPLSHLEKLADLFGCELDMFFEENKENFQTALTCAFRINNLDAKDIKQIAEFKGIVNNYLKMNRLLKDYENK